jgi:hypothetical protein
MEEADLQLPDRIPVLAPAQEWRTVWDSAIDRSALGGAIQSRFEGVVTYYDRPAPEGRPSRLKPRKKRRPYQSNLVLDWATLPPVQRLELLTSHDLARQEKQKLELLRSLLTYFHYATKETRAEIYRAEIDRINEVAAKAQDRWQSRQLDHPDQLDHTNNSDHPTNFDHRDNNFDLEWTDDISTPGRHHRKGPD